MKAIYTTPKLCKSPSGWYVWIRYNGKVHKFKRSLGLSVLKRERIKVASVIIQALTSKLKAGWDPNNTTTPWVSGNKFSVEVGG